MQHKILSLVFIMSQNQFWSSIGFLCKGSKILEGTLHRQNNFFKIKPKYRKRVPKFKISIQKLLESNLVWWFGNTWWNPKYLLRNCHMRMSLELFKLIFKFSYKNLCENCTSFEKMPFQKVSVLIVVYDSSTVYNVGVFFKPAFAYNCI